MNPETLNLIRDYEGQIALLKLRVEHLEGEEKRLTNQLHESYRMATAKPEELLEKLMIVGFPAKDIVDIYRILDEWHEAGGRPALLEEYRERWAAESVEAT